MSVRNVSCSIGLSLSATRGRMRGRCLDRSDDLSDTGSYQYGACNFLKTHILYIHAGHLTRRENVVTLSMI